MPFTSKIKEAKEKLRKANHTYLNASQIALLADHQRDKAQKEVNELNRKQFEATKGVTVCPAVKRGENKKVRKPNKPTSPSTPDAMVAELQKWDKDKLDKLKNLLKVG